MGAERARYLSRVKSVEREYLIVQLAMERLRQDCRSDPSLLEEIKLRDIEDAAELLEPTYLIRLFAEFEAGLRSFWLSSRGDPPSRTRDLLDGVAAKRTIPLPMRLGAHSIRDARNAIVHHGLRVPNIPIAESRKRLSNHQKL